MNAILSISVPFVAGFLAYMLGGRRSLVHAMVVVALLVSGILVYQMPVDQTIPAFGFYMTLTPFGRLVSLVVLAASLAMVIYSSDIPQSQGFVPCLCFVVGSLIATQLAENAFLIAAFLQLAALSIMFAIPGLHPNEKTIQVSAKYLSMVALSGFLIFAALLLIEGQEAGKDTIFLAKTVLVLLSIGIGILMAVAPLHLWLPDVGEHAGSLVTAIAVCLIGVAAVSYLLGIIDHSSWLLIDPISLKALQFGAGLTAIFGAVLAVGQEKLGRLAAYTAVHGAGYVLLGLTLSSAEAVESSLFLALVQPIMLLLLFFSVGNLVEIAGVDKIGSLAGIGKSAPIPALGFLVAGLAVAGYPPFAGFAGRWLIYMAAAREQPIIAVALLGASGLMLIAFVRAFHVMFFGKATSPISRKLGSSTLTILVAMIAIVLLGIFPDSLYRLLGEIVIGLSFVKIA